MQKLYFSAHDGYYGFELWESDGTATGTVMFKDINRCTNRYGNEDSIKFAVCVPCALRPHIHPWPPHINPSLAPLQWDMIVFNGKLFFGADDCTHGHELWVSDGTATGTAMVKDINTGASSIYQSYDDSPAPAGNSSPVRVPSVRTYPFLSSRRCPHQPLPRSGAEGYDRLQRQAILPGRRRHPWC